MTDVTRLLENPVEATTIVQNVVLLLVEHVGKKMSKRKEKRKKRLMRPLYTESVTSLDKCRVTFYWVIKCTLRNTTQ
jgi:hypothetical protein